ncbi:MAG TPA: hypothetical protein VIU36_00285 [Gammaproteobacteria bacterium]
MHEFFKMAVISALLALPGIACSGDMINASRSTGVETSDYANTDSSDIKNELLEIPLYRTISLHEPEAYAIILEHIMATYNTGTPLTEPRPEMRPILQDILDRRMAFASDDALRAFVSLILEQTSVLYDIDAELCDIYLGAYINVDIDQRKIIDYFSTELLRKEHEIISNVIQSSYNGASNPPDENKMEPLRLIVFDKVQAQYNDADKVLTDISYAIDHKGRYCVVNRALYQGMLDLPGRKSGGLIRYIFSE